MVKSLDPSHVPIDVRTSLDRLTDDFLLDFLDRGGTIVSYDKMYKAHGEVYFVDLVILAKMGQNTRYVTGNIYLNPNQCRPN